MSKFLSSIMLCVGLWACANDQQRSPHQADDYAIATQNYAVFAEKALSYQADFDWEGWGSLLADDVQYFLPDSTRPLVGKAAVLAYWKNYPKHTRLHAMRYSGFNHIPIQTRQPLHLSGLAGVYVFSMFSGLFTYTDGRTQSMRLNYYCHFNAQKRIDRLYSYHNPMPIMAAFTSTKTIK